MSFSMYDSARPYFAAEKIEHRAIESLSIAVHEGRSSRWSGPRARASRFSPMPSWGSTSPTLASRGAFGSTERFRMRAAFLACGERACRFLPQSVSSLDPLMKVGRQVRAPRRVAARLAVPTRSGARESREELFARYGLAPEVAQLYPHELSGGMARRVFALLRAYGRSARDHRRRADARSRSRSRGARVGRFPLVRR